MSSKARLRSAKSSVGDQIGRGGGLSRRHGGDLGGLKEKLLAAVRGGIRTALIPEENVKDLAEIPDNVKNELEIIPVKWIDEVLEHALERMPEPLPEVAKGDVAAVAQPAEAAADNGGVVKH